MTSFLIVLYYIILIMYKTLLLGFDHLLPDHTVIDRSQ
jgi:hypothetical protein